MGKKNEDTVTVYATDLLHEDGKAYQKGEPLAVSLVRGERLMEIGICAATPPAPPASDPGDVEDKMMRGKKG